MSNRLGFKTGQSNERNTHLASPVHTVGLCPATRATLQLESAISQELPQGISRLPRVIVRDLARDVMQDVRLTDPMSRSSADPTCNGAKVTEKSAIQGSEGTTGEGKLGRAVVGKERVRVLEERDEDEPVVDPKVGNKVGAEDLEEAEVVDCSNDAREPKYNANVGDDDLPILVRGEEGRLGHKVCK